MFGRTMRFCFLLGGLRMLRSGLCLYLTLVTAAGPCLCCCRTLDRFSPRTTPATKPEQTPQPENAGCCCHQKQPPLPAETPAKDCPVPPRSPNGPSCPCQEHNAQPVALTSSVAETDQMLPAVHGLLSLPDGLHTLLTAGCPVLQALAGQCSSPFLTGPDMLRALHILRC